MYNPTDEQKEVISAPLQPLSVVACAGSGKTYTAIERLIHVREEISDSRTSVALLSFSNTAVNTFRKGYNNLKGGNLGRGRVTIDTFDSFITSNIIRPHAYRTMGCSTVPFLLTGNEGLLNNKDYVFWYEAGGRNYPVKPTDVGRIRIETDPKSVNFSLEQHGKQFELNNGLRIFRKLGELGAYTHEFGKLWAIHTLVQQTNILKALANKFSHIIVDEAQDIGGVHQELLDILMNEGVSISLIGDPAQAIYEFAGADGRYLIDYESSAKTNSKELTKNFRSIPEILDVTNKISGRTDAPDKESIPELGAFYASYKVNEDAKLVNAFVNKILHQDLGLINSAVVYRSHNGIAKLKSVNPNVGQGKQYLLAIATIERDMNKDYMLAFKNLASCIISLLSDAETDLYSCILRPQGREKYIGIKLLLWNFLRDPDKGLPSGELKAETEWQPESRKRVVQLLSEIEKKYGYTPVDKIGNKLTKKGFIDEPLVDLTGLADNTPKRIRIDTVHQVKGESLDALLYVASKRHIEALLAGTGTELGRIGYVAITRAKYFFLLGVPSGSFKELKPQLDAFGFKEL